MAVEGTVKLPGMGTYRPTLSDLLDGNEEKDFEVATTETSTSTREGSCVECIDVAVLLCVDCQDQFCEVCFRAQHKKGRRLKHKTKPLEGLVVPMERADPYEGQFMVCATNVSSPFDLSYDSAARINGCLQSEVSNDVSKLGADYFMERAKYIPVRLSMEERKTLRLLKAALHVNEYTDNVDIVFKNKVLVARREHSEAFLMALACSLGQTGGGAAEGYLRDLLRHCARRGLQ